MMLKPLEGPVPAAAPPGRPAPHSIEVEQALIGAILVDNRAFERVQEIVRPEHFFDALHARIFETMASLLIAGKTASPMTLKTFFQDLEPLGPELPVWRYIMQLAMNAPTTIGVKDYAEMIVELSRRRTLIVIGEDLANAAYEASQEGKHSADLIDEAEQKLFDTAEKEEAGSALVPFSELVARNVAFAELAHQNQGRIGNISTGFIDLDNTLNGLRNTDLIIVAGRPSMGKTALATNIAMNVAKGGHDPVTGTVIPATPVGFFSLEMSNEQLSMRVLAAEAEISAHKIAKGQTSVEDIRALQQASRVIGSTPLHIDDRGGVAIAQLVSRARRMKRRHKIGLLVIDYLQLLHSKAKGKAENRVQELTEITIALKALAKELAIPVIALSQLSRGVDGRENKRPLLSDLRESGSIEQDADVVMFVYREHYYLKRSMPDAADEGYLEHQAKCDAAEGKAEVIIAKDRHGPGGIVDLHFADNLVRFGNLARSEAALVARGRS